MTTDQSEDAASRKATDAQPALTGDALSGPDWDGRPPSVTEGTEPPVRRRRRVSLRRRRCIGLVMMLLGGLIALAGIWLVATGLLARSQLQAVRDDVQVLRAHIGAGELTAAQQTAHQLADHAHRAHQLTTGPVWAFAAMLPQGGEPLQTVRAITAQTDELGHTVLPELVAAAKQLNPASLRRADGTIDLTRIAAEAPVLDRAVAQLGQATAAIADQHGHTWLHFVDTARTELLTQLTGLAHAVRSADIATHVAPVMLGEHGPQRYLMSFQNEAESRGTGGIPGAFAIVRADHGRLSFERFESDRALGSVPRGLPTGLHFGPGFAQIFGEARPTSLYVNSNVSPNFPYAGRVWLAMWRKHTGQQLDGAMAVDPTALSYLLKVTGPVTLSNGSKVTARNVVALTESRVYERYPKMGQTTARKAYLLRLARSVSKDILASRARTTALLKAASRAASERRLLVYSASPSVERELRNTALSGAVPRTTAPYVGLSIVNDGGNKLDYYLDRSLTWRRTGCGSMRKVTVAIRLTNNAPTGLPPYVTTRSDVHSNPTKPGDNRLEVSYYATSGALMTSVTVDGKPTVASSGHDLGHPVFTVDLELPRASTRTIILHLLEPAGHGNPIVLRQPLVRTLHVHLHDASCG